MAFLVSKSPWPPSLVLLLPLSLLTIIYLLRPAQYYPVGYLTLRLPFDCRPSAADVAVPAAVASTDVDGDSGKAPEPMMSILVGVHTVARKYGRRHHLRMAYAAQSGDVDRSAARVDIRFVLCRPADEEQRVLLSLEQLSHGDLIVLDCVEKADGGKTYTYFASMPSLFPDSPYDMVMKIDDDSYLRVAQLLQSLQGQPKSDAYYGTGLPGLGDPKSPPFMLGMGYALSWDLVEWISASEMVKAAAAGPEDVTTGKWLNDGGKAKNRINVFPRMYDYRGPDAGDFLPDTILVHQLKQDERLARTLLHFNATAGVHVPPPAG